MITLCEHNQIAYEVAVDMRHEAGKAAGAGIPTSIKLARLMDMIDSEH